MSAMNQRMEPADAADAARHRAANSLPSWRRMGAPWLGLPDRSRTRHAAPMSGLAARFPHRFPHILW